ncbi:MAG: hypothetical protein Q4F39_07065 [Bacteroidia bacterium]|nr:hypothetical protein [Bacteroidia bacterium]
MTQQPQTFKPILGEHPHGGKTAVVFFQDRYFRPCTEESAARAVYVEYDDHGQVVHSMVLFGC